jgi:hypothetical protein
LKIPDLINGVFEALGSVATWMNVTRLYRDKQVMGVNWELSLFWTNWSMWNIYYYPHLHQWFSFGGGISIAVANTVWAGLAMYYGLRRKS